VQRHIQPSVFLSRYHCYFLWSWKGLWYNMEVWHFKRFTWCLSAGPTATFHSRLPLRQEVPGQSWRMLHNQILIEPEIYRDVMEFADLHPTKCVQEHVRGKELLHTYLSDSASEARTRVFDRRWCLGILLLLRHGQGYHSEKVVGQVRFTKSAKMYAYSFWGTELKAVGVSPILSCSLSKHRCRCLSMICICFDL